jgi:hypothetical protein
MDTTPAIPLEIVPLNTFTAANGAGLPGSFDAIVHVGGTGTVEVQSNRARLTAPGGPGTAIYVRSGQTAADAVDLLVQFSLRSVDTRAAVVVRALSADIVDTGYRLTADTFGTIFLTRNAVTVATWAQQITYPFTYWMRLRAIGKWVNAKIWRTSDAQPGAWSLEYVDPDPVTGDRIALAARVHSTGTVGSVDFDDYLVMDDLTSYIVPIVPAPTLLPVFGAAQGQSSAVRAALDRRRRAGSGRVVIERNPG